MQMALCEIEISLFCKVVLSLLHMKAAFYVVGRKMAAIGHTSNLADVIRYLCITGDFSLKLMIGEAWWACS